ncbi:MAG: glucosyltransferase domain-containing protein [Leptospirales bacterium]|nr:glucosyltransferase domain-containing protein [Leptospirales bacterium]
MIKINLNNNKDRITSIKNYFCDAAKEFMELMSYNYKQFTSPVLFMSGLYILGIISIIRANFLYVDDLGRAIHGYRGWNNFSRYISDFTATILHADTIINDISPLPQLIVAILIAIASVIIVFVISGRKPSKLALIASLPVGLSPWFLECFSYKFDSPYIALSVFASVFPFLFVNNYFLFSTISILSLLIMCMTYQASSGIYALLVIMICLKAWNERSKTNKDIIIFACISAVSYIITMILFRILFMKQTPTYIDANMYPLPQLFSSFLHNFSSYIRIACDDFGLLWKFLLLFSGVMFLTRTVLYSKRNKTIALIVSIIAVIAMCTLSFGAYLFLQKTIFAARGMYGLGVFIAILGIYTVACEKKIFAIPALLLCWCFFVFSFSYGNALADQKRYNDFRTEIILNDLSKLYPDNKNKAISILLINSIDFAPSINNIAKRKPIIKRLVPKNLKGGWMWGYYYLIYHYNFNLQFADGWREQKIEEDGLELLLDTRYHTIKGNSEKILVILK